MIGKPVCLCRVVSRISVRRNMTKKEKKNERVTPGWTDISGPDLARFYPEITCTIVF